MFTKAQILDEIRRTAEGNNGRPLGLRAFETETGIRSSDWMGKLWARWSDAVIEAGLEPNELQGRKDDQHLLEQLALLAREIGRFPAANDLKLKARTTPGFPWNNTFERLGNVRSVANQVRDFAVERGWDDVAVICDKKLASRSDASQHREVRTTETPEDAIGYVYLLKSGRHHKIGRSNAPGRRERELQIQLPEKAEIVHEIKTDDVVGIENYWHNRFADRRKNGEWFELTAKDVAAFKRRKFM